MKKQFYRVKQLADQRVGRAEKTEILSVDLQNVEKTVDKIKQACQSASKRITASMQGSGSDFERRLAISYFRAKGSRDDIAMLGNDQTKSDSLMKKLNQTGLANSMLESSNQLGDGSVLGAVLSGAGNAQLSLAIDLCEYEMSVEKNVMAPMTTLIENDIPSIYQTKKKLSKAALDMDTCKSRYLAALKAAHGASKDMWAAASKADALKDEMEEETAKFESCQDSFTTEALTFVSREGEYADWIIKFMEAQLEYHRKAAAALEKIVPSMKSEVGGSSLRPVFGCPLEEHLKVQHRSIAFVLEECLTYLHEVALEEQGLFRMAGSAAKIRKLKAAFDAGLVDLTEFECDVHVIAGVLKQYLRQLPEPLMTFSLYDEWIQAASIQDNGARLQAYWGIVEKLPKTNKNNLRYLICFLGKLAGCSDLNKMNPSNIAIVIAPNIIYSENETSDASVNLHHTGVQSSIVEALIQHHSWFFPEGVDFFRHCPTEPNGASPTSNSASPPATKPPRETAQTKKASTGEFHCVTGGLLDDVISMINANSESEGNGTTSPDPAKNQIPRTHSAPAVTSPQQPSGATQFVLVQEKTKRQAPSPAVAQVKYMGSTSPPPHAPHPVKPSGQPPPPPIKNTPPLAPKPAKTKQ